MSRSIFRPAGALLLALVGVVRPSAAQDRETRVTLTVSPGFITFNGFGGSFGAAVARLSVSRDFTDNSGGEIAAFTLIPTGGASSQPACIQGAVCQGRSTPSALNGLMLSVFAFAGESPVRLSGGTGAVSAAGGEGLGTRSTAAALVGLEWVPRTNNSFAPTIGLRVAQLATPLAGARQIFLPGIGFSF